MEGLDAKWLGTLLKRSFYDAKPVEVISVTGESAVPVGENYSSDVCRIKLSTITASGSKKTFSMIVKKERTAFNEETQASWRDCGSFRVETKVYTNVLTPMEDLMNEFNDKRETLWAKLYGFQPFCNMVLEDLKDQNYILTDRTKWQGLDHSLLVLRNLGRYHAMTKVLLKRGVISQEKEIVLWASHSSSMKDRLIPGGLTAFSKVLLRNAGPWKAGWEEIGKRIQSKTTILTNQVADIYDTYDKKFEVLNHGDVWSSNMMFKLMEYTNQPVSVKFLDFQVPHLNSFIWDVTYFLFGSAKPSVRRAHEEELLSAYHQSLSENLKFFQYNDYIPSLEDIMNEYTRMSPAKLIFLIAIMPISSSTSKNAFDVNKLMSDKPEESYQEETFVEEKYFTEISEDLKEFVRLGAI